jgi:cytochrome P450
MEKYPADFHPQPLFSDIANEYNFRGLYYLDIYPFGEPMVFILDPSLVSQITSFSRHPFANTFLRGLVGTKSIFSTQGSEWSAQRSWFSPAFSASHILTLVPGMIEETLVFREKLTALAIQGKRFSMNDLCLRLAIDVIARSGFDIRLKSQSHESELYDAFQGAIEWTAGSTAGWLTKILSPVMMDWYTRKLDRHLGRVIRDKYAGKAEDGASKSILDLALKGYQKENGKLENGGNPNDDEEFMRIALDK